MMRLGRLLVLTGAMKAFFKLLYVGPTLLLPRAHTLIAGSFTNVSIQLKSNRTAAASSVLASVRSRHNDILQIETTLIELNQLFQDLAETITVQEPYVTDLEHQTSDVVDHTKDANVQLGKSVVSARKARKWKWVCCGICFTVLVAVVIILVVIYKIIKPAQQRERDANAKGGNSTNTSG
jgi:t-SNARE complex subunit (syntaxin)